MLAMKVNVLAVHAMRHSVLARIRFGSMHIALGYNCVFRNL